MNVLNRFNGPVRFAIAILLIGTLFKVMHWRGGVLIMSVALSLIFVFYGIKVFRKKAKTTLDVVKLILIGFWSIQGILTLNHLPYSNLFKYGFWVSLILWGLAEFLNDSDNKRKTKKEGLSDEVS